MKKLVNPPIIEKTVREHGIVGAYEVSIFLATALEMKKLLDNKYHDVLSFPLDRDTTYPDGIVRLGDIVICKDEENKEFLAHHGCLHLLGVHHK